MPASVKPDEYSRPRCSTSGRPGALSPRMLQTPNGSGSGMGGEWVPKVLPAAQGIVCLERCDEGMR